jgi:hypothetical protein
VGLDQSLVKAARAAVKRSALLQGSSLFGMPPTAREVVPALNPPAQAGVGQAGQLPQPGALPGMPGQQQQPGMPGQQMPGMPGTAAPAMAPGQTGGSGPPAGATSAGKSQSVGDGGSASSSSSSSKSAAGRLNKDLVKSAMTRLAADKAVVAQYG